MMTRTIMVSMMEQMMMTKLSTSRWSGVIPVLGSLVSLAMRPKTVRFPVATTTPVQVPETQ
jgi:hypothetical protein